MALFVTDYAQHWLGLVDGCRKFLYELAARRTELYDLCEDPLERQDLAPARPRETAMYRRHIEGWAAAVRAGLTDGTSAGP
jgi:hypothetical protein